MLVVSEVGRLLDVKLTQMADYRTYFSAGPGEYYCVKGAEKWHSLQDTIFQDRMNEIILIMAKRNANLAWKFEVFKGDMRPLFANKKLLSRHQDGRYSFVYQVRGDRILIKNIPTFELKKFGDIKLPTSPNG